MESFNKIYELTDPLTGEPKYIGKTISSLKDRLNYHIRSTKELTKEGKFRWYSHNINWIRSLLQQDLQPQIQLIDEVPTSEWIYWERFYISLYKSWDFILTNATLGGEGCEGFKWSEELKQKQREWKTGFQYTKESRQQMSQSKLGNQFAVGSIKSEESRQKISIGNKGKIVTEETRKKQSESGKIKIFTEEHCKHISEGKIGISIHTEESRQKISKNSIGKHSKPIFQLHPETLEIIKEWPSQFEAGKFLHCDVGGVLRGHQQTAGGFKWKYKEK